MQRAPGNRYAAAIRCKGCELWTPQSLHRVTFEVHFLSALLCTEHSLPSATYREGSLQRRVCQCPACGQVHVALHGQSLYTHAISVCLATYVQLQHNGSSLFPRHCRCVHVLCVCALRVSVCAYVSCVVCVCVHPFCVLRVCMCMCVCVCACVWMLAHVCTQYKIHKRQRGMYAGSDR